MPKTTAELQKFVESTTQRYLKSTAFTDRKLTDTPTDALSIVNRKYVNLSGTGSQRPPSPVLGQQYFDTTTGRPIFYNGTNWVDGAGSVS